MANLTSDSSNFMTYQQAATWLGIPLGTLYSWVHHKRIPHIRLASRMVRFSRVNLEKWLRERTVLPPTTTNRFYNLGEMGKGCSR